MAWFGSGVISSNEDVGLRGPKIITATIFLPRAPLGASAQMICRYCTPRPLDMDGDSYTWPTTTTSASSML
eukprot:6190024-Pleurochrysis_carterae.AAC.2